MRHVRRLTAASTLLVWVAWAAPAGAVTISSSPPPGGGVGVAYSHVYGLGDSGGCSIPLAGEWSIRVAFGALPPGLSLRLSPFFQFGSTAHAYLAGTPTNAGSYSGVVVASYCQRSASQAFHIVIVDTPPVFPAGGVVPPVGSVGAPYTFNVKATGTTPITYALAAGTLPDGLSLGADGLVSGTPTLAGNFGVTLTARNGILPDATATLIFVVAGPEPHITSTAPPDGFIGATYTFTYSATGTTPIHYSVTAGALPYGLSLSPAGVLDGMPTTGGAFTGTVTASNGISPDDSQGFSIVIHDAPPILTNAPPNGSVGIPYAFAFTATGTTPITYTVSAGALPDGLTLSAAGHIDGTPTAEGSFQVTITAANGWAPDAVQTDFIQIDPPTPPVITSTPPPGGPAGHPYTFHYSASGSTNISYSVTAGLLPPGLTLGADGLLSGTPTTANTYSGTVTATNGTVPDATQDFSIAITGAPPVITSGALPKGIVGTSYAFLYAAMGSTPMTYTLTAGALPGGLMLEAGGLVSGTPTTAGTFTGTVTVSNGVLPDATQGFSINVGVAPAQSSRGGSGGGGGAVDGLSLVVLLLGMAGCWFWRPRAD